MSVNVIQLEKADNIRDLGGYRTTAGRLVKSHKLLRAGSLAKLSPSDQETLRQYGLKTVVDLRSPQECQNAPDRLPQSIAYYNNSVFPVDETEVSKDIVELRTKYDSDPLSGFQNMINTYRDMVVKPTAQQAYRQFFTLLAANQTPGESVLYHCSAGKDRTGMATVYLLTVLGVGAETIRQDYLYSNQLLQDSLAQRERETRLNGGNRVLQATVRSLGLVANEYLDAALLLIDEQYGGLAKYLQDQLDVSAALQTRLREIYLE
ncbi:tyrosine-protein phosphatase [Lapidilactobacillus salsurivasis]